ncbi:MAG: hypothetical protein AABY22_14390, partial [Nanoarchaeota archaeon]
MKKDFSVKILATVKFNDGLAYVLENPINYTYYRSGNLMWGTDGLFYTCFKYEKPVGSWKAFGGRKFDITLNTGEVIKCDGQWWDAGYSEIENLLGVKFGRITYNTIDALQKCYVYYAASADLNAISNIINSQKDLPYYPYFDYQKVINFDKVRNNGWDKIAKLQRDKKSLIKQCK